MLKKFKNFTNKHKVLTMLAVFVLGVVVTLYAIAGIEYATRGNRQNQTATPTLQSLPTTTPPTATESQTASPQQSTPAPQTTPKTTSSAAQQSASTAASIAADEASAKAKELARCMEYQRTAWQTFQIRYQQALDYKKLRSSDYLSAYQNQLISLAEYNDLMTKAYDLSNDKTKQAYQMYYDDVIGQKCTNVQPMPQLTYWNG